MVNHSFKMVFSTKGLLPLFLVMLHTHKSMAQKRFNVTDLYHTAGENVTFRCSFPMSISSRSWRYYSNDNDTLADLIVTGDNINRESQYDGRSRAVIESHIYILTITNLNLNDTGRYWCSGMSVISEYRLYVLAEGHPHCRIVRNTSNQSVILTCDSGVERNYPDIRWFRDLNGSPLASSTHNKSLKKQITLSEEDEHAEFKCVIGTGDVTSLPSCSVISSAVVPTASISPSVARGNIGGAVNFTCTGSTRTGNISVTWDNEALLRFQGRYEVSDSELRIRNLKATDHETNVVCIVRANHVGTEEEATAILLINEYRNTNVTVPDKGNNLNTSSNGLGFIAGLIVAVMLAVILATFLIFLFVKRNKSRIKRYPPYPEHGEKADEYDNVSEKGGTRLNPDGVEYTAVGSVTYQRKEDQGNEIGSYDSVERNGGIVSRPGKDDSHNYEQMDLSKQIPEYQAGDDQADDETTPVYAEVNKRGSKFGRSHLQKGGSRASSGKPDGYARIEQDKFKQTENGTEDKMASEDTEYAHVNKKKGESRNQIFVDGYAKPDLQHKDPFHREIADWSNSPSAEKSKKQPGAPRYAAVVKNKRVRQIEMFEEVYSEPNVDQQHDNEDGNRNIAQSVKEIVGKKDSLDGYAKPMFDDADDNLRDSANGDALASVTEAEYAVADVTNERSNIPDYSKPDFNLSVDQVNSMSESTDPGSPLYAEVRKKEDRHNAQGEAMDSKKKEKPKYAKVKEGSKK